MADCANRRSNQKYLHYENVRNKFAKDVGFNYRRGDYGYNNSRDDPRHHQQQKRDRYDDRKIEYHRGGDKLKWNDQHHGGGPNKRFKRDDDDFYDENKKKMK